MICFGHEKKIKKYVIEIFIWSYEQHVKTMFVQKIKIKIFNRISPNIGFAFSLHISMLYCYMLGFYAFVGVFYRAI